MSMPLRPGERDRLGRYELLGRLGEGGMGTVYLGRDETGRRVAIKMVRTEFADDGEFRARFRSEVNRAKQVPPFSTAEVLDADPDHDPPYLVVEYVDGPSLATVIREQGPLSGSALHGLAVGIATALSAIHGAGVIHRDLKPGNVLIALGGVKVIDFGIARAFEATSRHTRTDQLVGTVAYMAPERFDPGHGRQVTPAADVFAWGAVVAYAATGRTPFAADSAPATAMRILTQPPELAGLPGVLRDVVARALAKEPQDRPTARELLDLLLAGDTPSAVSAPMQLPPDDQSTVLTGDRPARKPRGRRIALAAVAVIVLLAGVPLGLHLLNERTGTRAADSGAGPPVGSTSAPVGPSAAASASPQPAPVDTHAAILRGKRKMLIHLAEIDRDLMLDRHWNEVEIGDGTGARSLFRLIQTGVQYRIQSLRSEGHPQDSDTCVGVKLDPDEDSILVAAECAAIDATLFSLVPTDQKDEKGRPTYRIYNESFGFVQWSPSRKVLFVPQVGDATPDGSFSFVDRGPAPPE